MANESYKDEQKAAWVQRMLNGESASKIASEGDTTPTVATLNNYLKKHKAQAEQAPAIDSKILKAILLELLAEKKLDNQWLQDSILLLAGDNNLKLLVENYNIRMELKELKAKAKPKKKQLEPA